MGDHTPKQRFLQENLLDSLKKVRFWLLMVLFIGAPFHAFLITWLKDVVGDGPLISLGVAAWREIIIFIIGLIAVFELIIKKSLPKFDLLDWLIIAYTGVALLWLPFQIQRDAISHQWMLREWILGFRFDVIPFLFLLIVRHVAWKRIELMEKIVLGVAGVVVVFGLLHAVVLPHDFLTHFGYSTYQGPYNPDISLSACQFLEHSDKVCRAIATFGGPTRYGTYLLLIIGLLIPLVAKKNTPLSIPHRTYCIYWAIFWFALLNLVLTFSRSIWIALLVVGVVTFFWFVPKKMAKIVLGICAVIFAGIIVWGVSESIHGFKGVENASLFKSIFIRDISTNQHVAYLKEGTTRALAHPLGMGLGTAGPASLRFTPFLTENWYLQIAIEMGIFGSILFLAILIVLSKRLLEDKNNWVKRGLFLGLLGVAVAGLFTHSFEETTTVLILMGFAGIKLRRLT